MLNFNINLTSLAVILWAGMLVISGSIWVLSSQVRRLGDLMEQHGRASLRASEAARKAPAPRASRRGSTGSSEVLGAGDRPGQLTRAGSISTGSGCR